MAISRISTTTLNNEACDVCSMHEKRLGYVRNVTPPHRNTLSNADRTRPAATAEELFWTVKAALETNDVKVNGKTFNPRGRPTGFLHRFKKAICAIDSTTIRLALNCIDRAKHRRRKAAAKAHVLLDITSFLGVRRAFFVTRQRGPLKYEVKERREVSGHFISDEIIVLAGDETKEKYAKPLRRIFAVVELDGQKHDMAVLTNDLDWAAETVCELCRARWNTEVLFKELKQTLQFEAKPMGQKRRRKTRKRGVGNGRR